jgi:DNA-directed RNA polymerase subunit omega
MLKNKDGMRYPSIDKLLDKIDSKYKLVYAASKVARIIEDEKLVVENAQCVKSIGMALEEILNDKVQVDFET